MGTPNCAGHTGPWLLEGENTLDVVTGDLLSGDRVNNSRLNSKEGQRRATRLGRSNTTQRSDDVGTSLGLPVGLCILLADTS